MTARSCPELSTLINYVTGAVAEPDAIALDNHIQVCADCVNSLSQIDSAHDPVVRAIHAAVENSCGNDPLFDAAEIIAKLKSASPTRGIAGPWTAEFGTLPFAIGDRLGHYLLTGVLGRGGMGVVYEAEDEQLGRRVALKVIRREFANDLRFRSRFLQEARAIAGLMHDHLVPLHHIGEFHGSLFLVMPRLVGSTLADYLVQKGKLPEQPAIQIGAQIASGLAAAHAVGLVHVT